MTPTQRRNADPNYQRLLLNAQAHLLAMYTEKFKAEPDGSAVVEASFAAPTLVDPQAGVLPDGSHPTKFMWVQDGEHRKVVWS